MERSHVVVWASDSPTPAQLKEFFAQIESGRITKTRLQVFLRSKEDSSLLISEWQNFYEDVFGLQVDFSTLQIPKIQKGFDRLIVVADGMTPERLFQKCKELFPCWKWTDRNLDEIVISDRTAKNGPYMVRFRDRVETDEELKNLSADQLKAQGIPGITLEERFLYELKYFKETGQHLDIENITLCAGSRYSDGSVPSVSWSVDRLSVHWYGPGVAGGGLRSRQAVS